MITEATILIFLCYIFFISRWIWGNIQLKKSSLITNKSTYVSVVVPFRNEKLNLPKLIQCLKKQEYSTDKFEVVLVNDNSTDKSLNLLEDLVKTEEKLFKLVNLKDSEGKKAALKAGILAAKHEIIVTTDADCIMGESWLKKLIDKYEYNKPHLLAAPVSFRCRGFWCSILNTELAALMASTSGAIQVNSSFMCNGANLVFPKRIYSEVSEKYNHDRIPSGDDVFLLHGIKKLYGRQAKVEYAANYEALVQTLPPSTFRQWVNQRIRWAKKSTYYRDKASILTGAIIFLTNLSLIVALSLVFFNRFNFNLWLLLFVSKWALDYSLIRSANGWLREKNLLSKTFFLSLIYPFYMMLIALLSLLIQPTWKGRKI